MAFNKTDKADGAKVRRGGIRRRKKVCVFCPAMYWLFCRKWDERQHLSEKWETMDLETS